MTEIEKFQYTKDFIDMLANGVNPLDGKPVSEGDIVNNVRISRCLFYVSDILRQIIENGGITKATKSGKKPFSLTDEQLQFFIYSKKSIPISEIAKRLNDLQDDEDMKKLSHTNFYGWLLDNGILCEVETKSGKKAKRPTPKGNELGVTVETRIGKNGEYPVTVYNMDAQKLIIDNFEEILSHTKSD